MFQANEKMTNSQEHKNFFYSFAPMRLALQTQFSHEENLFSSIFSKITKYFFVMMRKQTSFLK